ncbi:hypothetical protein C8Q80DRAFT_1112641 [Daedaleopsis nitida]|nr:hypothetical protein C8Q80DRAFT_1112641 [Daedaleopsis nitida]
MHNYLDYCQYCQRVLDFLHLGLRARAAMLHGGIVLCLVIGFSSSNSRIVELVRTYITVGPTEDHGGHQSVGNLHGTQLWDDVLSEEGLALISGVTKIYASKQHPKEDKSWWPKHSVWHISGMYTGIWNPKNEDWFQERLKDICDRCAVPLNSREWRSTLGQYRACGKLAKAADAASITVFDSHLH